MIKINCVTGKLLPLEQIEKYPGKLKKHSMLEIARVKKSIIEDGLCFPITIGRVEGHNYIIDGEATWFALKEFSKEEVPDIPVVFVRCNAETLKKMIIIASSTNHAVTETSLKKFVEGTDINLKEYGFSDFNLIDFHTDVDIGLYVETIGGKFSEQKLNKEDFEGLLA